jgi:hypothetical protein
VKDVPGRTAFDNIDDPLDPAWIGHWERHERRRRRPAALPACAALLVCALLAVAGVIAAGVDGGTPAPKSPVRTTSPAPTVRTELPKATVSDAPLADDGGGDEAPPARPVTNAYPTGSGWAPADATIAPEDRGSGLLRGELSGLHPTLTTTLDALAVDLGRPIRVISGWRTRHEQKVLYDRFIAGTGNLAAVPGTSNHEAGWAADA